MSDASELKPCPFCGGPATLDDWYDEHGESGDVTHYYEVACKQCDYVLVDDSDAMASRRKWNTRDVDDQLTAAQQRVAELELTLELREKRVKLIEDKFHFTLGNTGIELSNECIEKDKHNARLRELLRECHYILLGDAAELKNRIKAELAEGE